MGPDRLAPRRLAPDDPALPGVLALLRAAFAFMAGRIDPPSSLDRMGVAELSALAREGVGLVIGEPEPVACLFCTPKPDCLYLGKLAVAEGQRGRGLARTLIAAAEGEARARGLPRLILQTRVELTGNHATFQRLGFQQTGAEAHAGYSRPTSYIFTRECA